MIWIDGVASHIVDMAAEARLDDGRAKNGPRCRRQLTGYDTYHTAATTTTTMTFGQRAASSFPSCFRWSRRTTCHGVWLCVIVGSSDGRELFLFVLQSIPGRTKPTPLKSIEFDLMPHTHTFTQCDRGDQYQVKLSATQSTLTGSCNPYCTPITSSSTPSSIGHCKDRFSHELTHYVSHV